jgi:hypothetical protein
VRSSGSMPAKDGRVSDGGGPDRGANRVQDLGPGRRYLVDFQEDTMRERPLWIRLIIEFAGTFVLVTVAAGAG